jgi:cobalt/nickel transport system permease protein
MREARSNRHPAHSLAVACAMIAGAVATRSLAILGALGLIGAVAMHLRRVPFGRVVARLRATVLVVGGAILLGAFTSRGHALRDAASLAARVFDAALWATWLVSTDTPLELDEALRALGAPRGIVALLALTRRFGVQLRTTMRSAWNATALRGGFRTPRTTASSVGAIAGVVLVRALDRAHRTKLALDLRGGDGALLAGEARFSWTSWVALLAVFGAVAIADRAWGRP